MDEIITIKVIEEYSIKDQHRITKQVEELQYPIWNNNYPSYLRRCIKYKGYVQFY